MLVDPLAAPMPTTQTYRWEYDMATTGIHPGHSLTKPMWKTMFFCTVVRPDYGQNHTNRARKTTLSVLLHNWTWSHLHCSCHYARIFFSFHGFVTYCGQVSTLLVTAIPDFETIIHTIAFLNLSLVKFLTFFLGIGLADYWSPLLYSCYILKNQTRLKREWC